MKFTINLAWSFVIYGRAYDVFITKTHHCLKRELICPISRLWCYDWSINSWTMKKSCLNTIHKNWPPWKSKTSFINIPEDISFLRLMIIWKLHLKTGHVIFCMNSGRKKWSLLNLNSEIRIILFKLFFFSNFQTSNLKFTIAYIFLILNPPQLSSYSVNPNISCMDLVTFWTLERVV